jgi:MFS transporter, DHA2 family, multidrug resistance protein
MTPTREASVSPSRAGLVLLSLILVAAVANMNLAVANVALPDIGKAFDAGQTAINLVAVGYSLGLAASVLYLGALGDRYGRKLLLILGTSLAIPASLLAAFAPSVEVLFVARLLGGLAAGMAFPTTLALITALWSGPARTKSIAVVRPRRRDRRARSAALRRLADGVRLGFRVPHYLAAGGSGALPGVSLRTSPRERDRYPVDNLGGILSVLLVAALVLAINFARCRTAKRWPWGWRPSPSPRQSSSSPANAGGRRRSATWTWRDGGSSGSRRARGSSFSARLWGRCSLVSSSCRTCSAKLVDVHGARFTLLLGYAFCLLGFVTMLLLWQEDIAYWKVALAYALIGIGVGFAGTPA